MSYIERGGVKVYYESFGQGTPIVFLHAIGTNRYLWANQLFSFGVDHRVIVLDHRGHGLSDKPTAGYSIAEMAADVIAVLDDAKIDKAVLVGNSMGGMVVMQANLDAPERVMANVILSSGTNLAGGQQRGTDQSSAGIDDATLVGMVEAATSAKTKRERAEVLDFVLGLYRMKDNFPPAVFFAIAADPGGLFHWNILDRLKDIRQPTLIFAGRDDRMMPVEVTQRLADNIPGAQLKIVPDVGHFYQLERPADFNNDLRSFLKKVGG